MPFFPESEVGESEVGKDVKSKGYQRVALKLGLTKRSSAAIAAASDDTRPVETGSSHPVLWRDFSPSRYRLPTLL